MTAKLLVIFISDRSALLCNTATSNVIYTSPYTFTAHFQFMYFKDTLTYKTTVLQITLAATEMPSFITNCFWIVAISEIPFLDRPTSSLRHEGKITFQITANIWLTHSYNTLRMHNLNTESKTQLTCYSCFGNAINKLTK